MNNTTPSSPEDPQHTNPTPNPTDTNPSDLPGDTTTSGDTVENSNNDDTVDTHDDDPTIAPDTAEQSPSALTRTPKIVWVLTALIATGAALGGYIVGHQVGENSTKATIAQTVEAALNAAGNTQGTSNAQGAKDTQALSFEEITKKLKPGSDTSGPKPTNGDTYNANITGGRAPVKGPEDALNVHRRNPYDPFAIGRVDAPVVITEFSDFECPFCSYFANSIEPALIKKYVDTGYVRIEYNDLPVNGPHAIAAAKAGRAAAAQGRFPQFAQALFEASKNTKGHPAFEMKNFIEFARKAGVPDMARFEKEASSDMYLPAINKAKAYADQLGIHSTPSFVIGKVLVDGARPVQQFEKVIDAQLANVANGSVKVPAPDDKAGVN